MIKIILFILVLGISLCYPSKAFATPSLHRISGLTRYETASSIAKEGWPNGSKYAVLAYGENFPDALVATPLAVQYDAPILLTDKQSLTPVTKDTLISLGTRNVFIIGGSGVISPNIESQLQSMDITVTRLSGNDRYETSVSIANRISNPESKLIVTTGMDFPDALSISSFAGEKKIPIVLADRINDSLKQYLATHNIQQTFVIGNMISDSVVNTLPNVAKIQGIDKYDTNLTVLKTLEPYYNFDTVFVATGNNFADALAGSAYAAKTGSPLVLSNDIKNEKTGNYLTNPKITQLDILGGEGVLPSTLINSYFSNFTYTSSEISKMLNPSVVYIEIYDQTGLLIGSGSGFIVDSNGKIATNYHVIKRAYSAKVKTYDGKIYDVKKVLAYEQYEDMALIKIDATGLIPVTFGDSDQINTGDRIYAIGNPLGMYQDTISDGSISTKSRLVNGGNFIQFSAPISPGSCGGVLVNEQGIVIGITATIASNSIAQNINFAIPINLLKPMLSQDADKTLSQIQQNTNPAAKTTLNEVQIYIQQKYGFNVIAGQTIKYSVNASSYLGEPDGRHFGDLYISFITTPDSINAEDDVIINHTLDYTNWLKGIMNDIQTRYGIQSFCGGVLSPKYNKPTIIFNNWSGNWIYTVPK